MREARVLTAGASAPLGRAIADGLEKQGYWLTRTARSDAAAAGLKRLDLTHERAVRTMGAGHTAAILTPILTVSAPAARWLSEEGVQQIIVFSSNNVAIDQESPVYTALRDAEASLAGIDADIAILRPTMIYGYPGDGNLHKLLQFAQRWGFLPCPGSGRAFQQPVFFEDVAAAVIQAISRPGLRGHFSVGGPDVMPARQLFKEVLIAAGRKPGVVVPIPLAPLRLLTKTAEALGLDLPLNTRQLARMEMDKTAAGASVPGFMPQISISEGLKRLAAN